MVGCVFDRDGVQIADVSTYVELDDDGNILKRYRASSCSLDDDLYSSAFAVADGALYEYSTRYNTPRSEATNEEPVRITALIPVARDQLPDAIRTAIAELEARSQHDAAEPGQRWTWWSG
jgi:hypothetical protein